MQKKPSFFNDIYLYMSNSRWNWATIYTCFWTNLDKFVFHIFFKDPDLFKKAIFNIIWGCARCKKQLFRVIFMVFVKNRHVKRFWSEKFALYKMRCKITQLRIHYCFSYCGCGDTYHGSLKIELYVEEIKLLYFLGVSIEMNRLRIFSITFENLQKRV